MVEKKKAGDVLAKADFRLVGTGWSGEPVDTTVHAELLVSGAFKYGNGTCMTLQYGRDNDEVFDTRYEDVSAETFADFAYNVLRDKTLETIDVEVII